MRKRDIYFTGIVLPKDEAAGAVDRGLGSELADTAGGLLDPFVMVLEQGQEKRSVRLADWLPVRRPGERKTRAFCQGALGLEDFFCDGVRHSVIAWPNVRYWAEAPYNTIKFCRLKMWVAW